ncbi:MAG: hypothetical protein ACP6IY_20235 [Promethearchaeia archaeon]
MEKVKISPNKEKHIRNVVKGIFKKLITLIPDLENYQFGGSFDRYTNIKNSFDVDIYFIGKFSPSNLLNYFKNRLKDLERSYNSFKIARPPPYLHAIPAIINDDVEIDCLPTIELKNSYFKIPEGNDKLITINPSIDEKMLIRINKNNSGMGTKLIRLLKKWNFINNKPFKSYQLERLFFQIFKNKKIISLDKGLKTFFNDCITFLKNGGQIFDKVDNHAILKGLKRKKAISIMKNTLRLIKEEKWTKVFPKI